MVVHAMSEGSSIGTTEQLMIFGEIFFGSLLVAALYFGYRHIKHGLALPPTPLFDWTTLGLALWCFSGMLIDAWAHKHGQVDDSFFTPWHAVWYSGFTAYAGYIMWALWRLHDGPIPRNLVSLKSFLNGMPKGYAPGILGIIVFSISAFGDMLWHTFLGIEGGTDILLSPTHLGLAAGLILSLMVPVTAAWHRAGSGEGFIAQLPLIFGLAGAWSVITLFTTYAHHLTLSFYSMCMGGSCPPGTEGLELGITAILLQSIITTGFVLWFMRRWKPVFGTFTLLFAINGIAIAAFAGLQDVGTPLLSGILIDVGYNLWGQKHRLFAFTVPALPIITWFILLEIAFSIGIVPRMGWSVHATIGVIFLAGSAGLLMSCLTEPVSNNMQEIE
jgi:hypothetical protein